MAERIVIEIDGVADGAVRETKRAADAVQRSARDMQRAAAQSAGAWQDASGRWRSENGRLISSAEKTALGLDGIGDSSRRNGAALQAMARKQRESLGQLATVAKRTGQIVGAAAAAATAHIIKVGADFEQEMARVKAVLGASAADMERLNETAKKLGADTKFSAGEAAGAMYELASAGFDVDESIQALPGTLSLAAASGIELKDAAEISSNALRGFQLDTKESGKVADIMAEAVNRSSLEMQDLQLSMKYIAAAGSTTGQSIEEMTAATSLMADAGIKGEQAGTTLRAALLRLTNPVGQAEDGLAAMGVAAEDLRGPNGLKPLGEILATIERETRDMDRASRNAALTQIFGQEAFTGMAAVLDAGAPKYERLVRAYERSDGAAERTATTMNTTVRGAFEEVTGSIETVEIALFQKFQEPMRRALQSAAATINREGKQVEEFFDNVMGSQEFQTADLRGQIQILAREIGGQIDQANIPARLSEAFSRALPVMARAAGEAAGGAAKAFGEGFIAADPLGRLVMATWLLSKTGGIAAFRAAGSKSGGAFMSGAATTMGKSHGIRNALVANAKAAAPLAAAAFAVAYGPEIAKAFAEGASSKTRDYGLPKNKTTDLGPFNFISDGISPFRKIFNEINKTDGAKKKLKEFGDTAEDTFKKLSEAKDVRGLAELSDQARALAKEFPAAAPALTTFAGDVSAAARSMVDGLDDVALKGGSSLEEIRKTTIVTGGVIKRRLGRDTETGKDALARNFSAAAKAVEQSMDDGVVSTEDGVAEINRLMRKALAVYGITGKEADKALSLADPAVGRSGGGSGPGAARGGFFLGQPGAKGRDEVPMMVNGRPVIAAEGEYVGIFNRHQQKALNQRLADQGGLSGFMAANNRPHHMATGGIIPAAAGMVTGDTDFSPELGKRLRAMSAATNTPIFVQSGGRTLAEQAALYAKFKGGRGALAAPPNANAPHVRGIAADITPGRDRFGGIAARFGLGFTVPSESWHIQLLGDAVAAGAITVAEAEKLKRVMWDGPDGALGAMGQSGLDSVRRAAQEKLDQIYSTQVSSGGDGAFPGIPATGGAGGSTGAYKSFAQSLFQRFGWTDGQFGPLDQLWTRESGWNPRARNPSSGAYGIPQALPASKMASAGPDWLTNPQTQIRWGLRYIKDRYGAPSSAWAHSERTGWYSGGGIIQAAAGHVSGGARGPDTKRKDKKAPPKKKPRRTRLVSKLETKLPNPIFKKIAALVGDESQMGAISVHDTLLAQMRRAHDRTDEQARIAELNETNPDGSYKVPPDVADAAFQNLVQQAIGELWQQFGAADKLVAFHGDPHGGLMALRQRAIDELEAGAAERSERVKEIVSTAKANEDEIRSNLKVFHRLTRRIREAKKKKRSRATVRGLKREQDQVAEKIGGLRKDRERLIGTRSIETPLSDVQTAESGGMLGSTRQGLRRFREELPTQRRDLQSDTFAWLDRVGDRQDIADQIVAWQGRRPEPRATVEPDTSRQDLLADLARQQAQEAQRRANLSEGLLGVLGGFAPLVGQRLVGAFAQGVDHVPRTGLALVHRDERILPDPDGAFGLDQRTTQSSAPVVNFYADGNLAPLVGMIRAEVDGRAARVVSRELGRRSRAITAAPGGR